MTLKEHVTLTATNKNCTSEQATLLLLSHPSMSSFINFPQSAQSFWNDHTSMKNASKELRINEVFLSFRGKDTRASFTSHLYASLQNSGINVYRDDHALPKGDGIPTSLKRTIKSLKFLLLFSQRTMWNQVGVWMSCWKSWSVTKP